MKSTEIVAIDIASPNGPPPVVHAVAGDIYSRFLQMHLYAGGVPFEPPGGTTCTIGWRRQNGDSGAYNSILEEDGSSSHPAWELEGNVLTIELDWHVCQHPGDVAVNVSLNGEGGSRLHTWELCCRVARGAVADADDPTKPSESATDAANRAEQAAADAQDSAADLADAVKRAEEAAQRAAWAHCRPLPPPRASRPGCCWPSRRSPPTARSSPKRSTRPTTPATSKWRRTSRSSSASTAPCTSSSPTT